MTLEELRRLFALPPAAFTYVADNPVKDFVAPRRLGWRTLCVERPGRVRAETTEAAAQVADRTIASLSELGHS